MSDTAVTIRMAEEADAAALLSIYAPYVEKTAITFEYEVPTVQEFKNRITSTLKRYPYLAAIRDGRIIGYAYASQFKERAAYDWAVETSVYVSGDARRTGAGSLLYEALENYLRRQNVINVNACIAYPNPGSITFHEKYGYHTVGHFTKCGYKLGQWWIWSGWKKCWALTRNSRNLLYRQAGFKACLFYPIMSFTHEGVNSGSSVPSFLHFLYCSIVNTRFSS